MGWIESIKSISKTDTAKNSAILLMANVISQLLGIVFYPILTRIYSPDDFGLLNLFVSIGAVLVLCSTAEYQYSIMLPKSDKKAIACFHVGLFLLTLTTLLCIVSVFFSDLIASIFNVPELAEYYWLMPFYVFFIGVWNLFNYWLIRKAIFSCVAVYQLTLSIVNTGLKCLFGLVCLVSGGLILSTSIAVGVAFLLCVIVYLIKKEGFWGQVDVSCCKIVIKEYNNFPIYSLPRSLINMFFGQMPVFLLTPYFGTEQLGFWSMAILVAFTPISMISRSMHQVLYGRVVDRIHQEKPIIGILRKFVVVTIVPSIILVALLYPILPFLLQFLLGEIWALTGEYIRFMLPWLVLSLVASSVSFLSDVFLKQRKGLFFEIVLAVARLLGLLVGVYMNSFPIAVAGYALGSALAILCTLFWYFSLVKKYEQSIVGK